MFLGSPYIKYVFVFIVLSYFVRIIYDVHVLRLFWYLHLFFGLPNIKFFPSFATSCLGALKPALLHEIVNLVKDNPYPIIIEGILIFLDALMRRAMGGSTSIGHSCSMLSLTIWIWGRSQWLRDKLHGKTDFRADLQETSRVPMNSEWEVKYPIVSVRALPCLDLVPMIPYYWLLELQLPSADNSSNLNLDDYIGMDC
jgi:hypothetical protein